MKEKKLQDEVAQVAYELYEKRGGTHGCDFDDWVEAEKIVKARHAKGKAVSAPAGGAKKPAGPAKKGAASARHGSAPAEKKAVRKKTGKS